MVRTGESRATENVKFMSCRLTHSPAVTCADLLVPKKRQSLTKSNYGEYCHTETF